MDTGLSIERYGAWRVLTAGGGKFDRAVVEAVIRQKNLTVLAELKNDRRSLVRVVRLDGRRMVLKAPREKNRRPWIRFTTLYRHGAAFASFVGMQRLKRLGIDSSRPVMALEKRRWGMVVDSWLLYEYVDGRVCGPGEYQMVVGQLAAIHAGGLLHGDPQIRNFLFDGTAVVTIDAAPKRPLWGGISRYGEFFYLRHSAPDIEAFLDLPRHRPACIAAAILCRLYWGWRDLKKKWKRRRKH